MPYPLKKMSVQDAQLCFQPTIARMEDIRSPGDKKSGTCGDDKSKKGPANLVSTPLPYLLFQGAYPGPAMSVLAFSLQEPSCVQLHPPNGYGAREHFADIGILHERASLKVLLLADYDDNQVSISWEAPKGQDGPGGNGVAILGTRLPRTCHAMISSKISTYSNEFKGLHLEGCAFLAKVYKADQAT